MNVGSRRFANVSSVTELYLPDDSRGLALADWDFDGRVDFWLTNRNGPRVRFLKNEYSTGHHYLALRLAGTRANRDAVGARVEVYRSATGSPLVKTVYAGSGYISQSTKWLHFGLGPSTEIDRVVVRWPGGHEETFRGISSNQHYQLEEGSGVAEIWNAPRLGPWKSSLATEPHLPQTSRVVLLEPAPMPQDLRCRDLAGNELPIVSLAKGSRGLLINLWATWCPNCVEELSNWSQSRQALRDAGIDVLAICVDEPRSNRNSDGKRIAETRQHLKIPFDVVAGDRRLVEILNVFQRAFIGRQSDLPLPSSLLIDAEGRLAVIYKGPVTAEQLMRDANALNGSRETILSVALPFSGRWLERPPFTNPREAAVALVEHGFLDAAESYTRQLLPLYNPTDTDLNSETEESEQRKTEYSSLHHLLGAILFDRQQFADAQRHFEASLEILPHNRGARQELYRTFMKLGQLEEAANQLEFMLEDHADDPEKLAELGRIRFQLGQSDVAIELFGRSLSLRPNHELRFEFANKLRDDKRYAEAVEQYRLVMADLPSPVVFNNLAWLLATASDEGARDGTESVRLAQAACEKTARQSAKMLGTLAAAHAERGEFNVAAQVIQEAIERARNVEDTLIPELEQRLRDYENRKPTRD
jgi:tetratricopeptide (TPR) repeat protein/thiol-disulfide isomerase/thioredoxin